MDPVSRETALLKMWKNGVKAVYEKGLHQEIPSFQDILLAYPKKPLPLRVQTAKVRGRRNEMQDAHFVKRIELGTLLGIFDGHGGAEIARLACQIFEMYFEVELRRRKGNVHGVFESLIDRIHNHPQCKRYPHEGSTALICFIDHSRLIYTATLGDSEAYLLRRVKKGMRVIPLSVIRNWKHPKEALRASIALKDPKIALEWPKAKEAKKLRYPSKHGINVSRAVGNRDYRDGPIPKAKISVQIFKKGDFLVMGCDGLFDFVTASEMAIGLLKISAEKDSFTDYLLNLALNEKKSTDNISIITARVQQ